MGDVKISSNHHRKSTGRPPSVSDTDDLKITTGTSGSTISNLNLKNGIFDEEEDDKSSRTRRGRSSNFKGFDLLPNKLQSSDSDAKNGSPSGPAAYLNRVRNNLNFDNVSSPMHDKTSLTSSGIGSIGGGSGYKLPQKRRNRGPDGMHHKPAEIFRKDLISAMKIPDTSQLAPEEYWVMRDPWRMEWEKGVQVPVNPGGILSVKVEGVPKEIKGDFRMPRKLIKTTPDVGDRDTVNLNVLADSMCRYDLDEVDVAWLEVINEERERLGYQPLDEFTMEIIMEELETQCHENLQLAIKTKEGLGIEYDENIVCDVCRTPECEEGNEMVFCDGCNLCVHQACYGILKVPEGSWLCKPCALGIRGSAVCILCGKKGGALKSTKSGRKWAHMSCALWIPEITIADPERMEPITKVSHIPSSRWSLVCTVCKERSVGACIQCSVRHCVTAYHVTCAMEDGFDMITDCVSPNSAPNTGESAIIFRSYCRKHSKNLRKKSENSPGKKTEEEKRSDRQKRIAELEEEFFTLVKCEGVANALNIPAETVSQVMEFWKLKRKANFNRPLVTPKQEEGKALEEAAETGLQRRLRMFTHLRQDLERVRNLCYMIQKREKMKRSSVKIMSNVFLAQIHYLEYRMSHSTNFEPKSFVPTLPKFGSPETLEIAKQESLELAKTKEWSNGTCSEAEPLAPEPGDYPLEEEPIRLPQPRMNVDVTVKSTPEESRKDKPNLQKHNRKNGLVTDAPLKNKNKQSPKNLNKKEEVAVITDGDCAKKKRPISETENLVAKTDSKKVENRKKSSELRHADSNSELTNGENSDSPIPKELKHRSHRRLSKKDEVAVTSNDDDARRKSLKSRTENSAAKTDAKKIENRKKSHELRHADSNCELTNGENSDSSIPNELKHRSHRRLSKRIDRSERDVDKEKTPASTPESNNHDTVKGTDSNQKSRARKGRLKPESAKTSNDATQDLQRDLPSTRNDTDTDVATSKTGKAKNDHRSSLSSSPKKLRKRSKEQRDSKHGSPSPVLDAKKNQEKFLRSPRRDEVSNSDDSDASTRRPPAKPRMTISTETISETIRFDTKSPKGESRKRNRSKNAEKLSQDEEAKKTKLDTDHSNEKRTSRRKSPRTRLDASSADETETPSTRSLKKSSKTEKTAGASPMKQQKKPSSRDSSLSDSGKKTFVKHQAAKNGRGALAPSLRGRSKSAACDKTDDTKIYPKTVRRSSGQELVDQNITESPPKLSEDILKSPVSKSPRREVSISPPPKIRSPILNMDEPNPAFIAAGLDIGYGSSAPAPLLRQNSHKKSPASNKSSGLKWVPLGHDIMEDTQGYPGRAATPKDQEGYRGDMDESDSESQNLLHKRKLSSRKRSSTNPGKYRTGIGVLSPKSSDSSEDDFDLSFSANPMASVEKTHRQKLRSISNTSLGETDHLTDVTQFPTTSTFNNPRSIKSCEKSLSPTEKHNRKIIEPKNVKAVGGIQGALKSERDVDAPPFYTHTTGGQNSQDNFFEKFSFLNEVQKQPAPFVDPTKDAPPPPFVQNDFIQPRMIDFHGVNAPFQSHTIFPYGAINPWQMTQPTLFPSIVPNQYPLPVYCQYPPPQHRANVFDEKVQPSPPQMPDSTLSPESIVPSSASVAVQASSDHSATPQKFEKTEKDPSQFGQKYPHPSSRPHVNDGADNEWEVVKETAAHDESSTHRRRKHKKKKKKKKRRRMLFPDEYDLEKHDLSSPSTSYTEPTYGAIVPRGHSTQYDVHVNSPVNSGNASSSTRIESDSDRKNFSSPKLVLKINKRDIIMKDEDKYEKKIPSIKIRTNDTFSSDSPMKTQGSGLKLTFKKSQYEHILKKYKHRRKLHSHVGQHFSSYTVSSPSGPRFLPIKPKVDRKTGLLRRLGLDVNNLPPTDETEGDGIGKRALRERKLSAKQEGPDQMGVEKPQRKLGTIRPRHPAGQKVQSSSPSKLRRRDPRSETNPSVGQGNVSSTPGGPPIKRGRGRPRKIRRTDAPGTVIKQEPPDAKSSEQNKAGENKDLAKFAGWSTKTSKTPGFKPRHSLPGLGVKESPYFSFKPSSSGSFRNKPGGISIRSFSTDSDQNSSSNALCLGQQPARHWKKRKVREHETQISEHPDPINSPDPSTSAGTEKMTTPWNPQPITAQDIAKVTKSMGERTRDISQPVKLRLNRESHSMNFQGQKDRSLKVASLPQAVRKSSEYNPKTKTLNLNLEQIPTWSSIPKHEKVSQAPPSKEKSVYEIFASATASTSNVSKANQDCQGTASTFSPSASPKTPKSKTPATTPTKPHPPELNLGFAMQTGPLNNFKIPKKLHQTNSEAKLPTDTLD